MTKLVKIEDIKDDLIIEVKSTLLQTLLNNQAELGLTPAQIVYLLILYFEDYACLYKYCQTGFNKNQKFPFTKDEVDSLYYNKLITECWTTQYPDEAVITVQGRKLIEKLIGVKTSAITKVQKKIESFGEELVETYPSFFYGAQGQAYPTKGYNKTAMTNGKIIEGQYALFKLYYDTIEGSTELHNEILEKIKYGLKLNGFENKGQRCSAIRTTLMKFVINKNWTSIHISDSDSISNLTIL